MTVGVRSGAATDVGRVRERNEDSVLVGPAVFAVADGMGGHEAGDVASALAVAGLGRFDDATTVDTQSVIGAIRSANTEILRRSEEDHGTEGMGTTVSGVALTREDGADALLVFNVGDSRTYRFRDGAFSQISEDHSLVAELVQAGELSTEAARSDKRRNVVTRALGVEPDVEIDYWLLLPVAGDRYLLCSDGLTNELTDEEIAQVVGDEPNPAAAAPRLVELAVRAGGHDNVSVVVVDIDSVEFVDSAVDDDTGPRPVSTVVAPARTKRRRAK